MHLGYWSQAEGRHANKGSIRNQKTLPVACARPEVQPEHWTQARPVSNVGCLHQKRTTPWEAQHTKNLSMVAIGARHL